MSILCEALINTVLLDNIKLKRNRDEIELLTTLSDASSTISLLIISSSSNYYKFYSITESIRNNNN